jgi:predicted acetyltransferase
MVRCMTRKPGPGRGADGLKLARLGPEEFPKLARLAGIVYYGAPPSDAEVGRAGALLDLDRSLGVRDAGELVATAATCHVELTVPGGRQLPGAGLTEVAVLPTHRRRGLMRRMVAAHLHDARARGELVSVLMATEGGIYGHLGYGIGTLRADWELARAGAALRDGPAPGQTRMVAAGEAMRVLPRLFDAHRRTQPGQLDRPDAWWQVYVEDPSVVYKGAGPLQHAVFEGATGVEGYTAWRLQPVWQASVADHVVTVVDLVTLTDAATDGLLRLLTGVDLAGRLVLLGRPVDDPLRWRLADPRRLRPRDLRDFLWLRLVDLAGALAARAYPLQDTLVLELVDPLGMAARRWQLDASPDGAACAPTSASADLTLSLGDLGTAFLGGVGVSNLWRAGRIDEHTPGAVARTERLFRTPADPWCSTQL